MSPRARVPSSMPAVASTERLTPTGVDDVALRLVVLSGAQAGESLELAAGTWRVGKAATNDLIITDASVSREHLQIEVLEDGVQLTDLGSTNGSFCDGVRLQRAHATVGAVIKLGRVIAKVVPSFAAAGPTALSEATSFGELRGQSVAMRTLFALAEKVARSDATVLITGETGTGKELLARALHQASARSRGPLVVADLSSLTPSLIESELFGHRKGSFTGAISDRVGLIEQGHRGTVFFDEVAELPLQLQPRLLRALERREVRALGASDYRAVDFRVVAATHKDLAAEVKAKRFREDLYHRLFTVQLVLPPLRERRDDLELLIDAMARAAGRLPSEVPPLMRAALKSYSLPGNVRELKNLVERQLALGSAAELPDLERLDPAAPSRPSRRQFKDAKNELVDDFERRYLVDLLERFKGNVTLASQAAGIDRVYLHRLLKKHQLPLRS